VTEAENRLIETYRKHQQHIEPHGKLFGNCLLGAMLMIVLELKATLQASLQTKVASLEEDKWMFEAEDLASS
jgi:hypothetical protein